MIKRLEFGSIAFVFLGALVGLVLVGYMKNNQLQFQSNAAELSLTIPGVPTAVPPTETPTPTEIFVPSEKTDSQISPDGTKTVTVKTEKNRDKTQTVTVSTNDNESAFFTKIIQADESIILPFNTWDPQDKYFFLQEKGPNGQTIMVFKGNGEAFADGSPYLNLSDAYTAKTAGNPYEVTGWAGYNVIVLNTTLDDGSQGQSYWYEVPSGAIIPLSTKF